MSMLAERKSKQKWCLNPRGKDWAEDANRFGQKMLEKMGWSNGKGLGAKLDGIKEHVKISYKNDSRGMGFKETGDQWTSHEDNFSKLLAQLKDAEHTTKIESDSSQPKSLEKKSKSSRARVHYHKFTRGKDLSRYSEKDLANIFGRKELRKAPVKQEAESTAANSDDDLRFGVTTVTGGSMVDYFKKKNPNLQVGVKSEFRVGKNGVLEKNSDSERPSFGMLEKNGLDSDSERPSFGFGFQNGNGFKKEEESERPAFGFGFQNGNESLYNNFIKRDNEKDKKSLYNGFVKSEGKSNEGEKNNFVKSENKLNEAEGNGCIKLEEENVSPRKKCKKGKKSEDAEDKSLKKKCRNTESQDLSLEEHKSSKKKSKSKSNEVNLEENPKQDSEAELSLDVNKSSKKKSKCKSNEEQANFKENSSSKSKSEEEAELSLEVNKSSKKKLKSKSNGEQTQLEEYNSPKKIKNKNCEDASSDENKSPKKKMKNKQLDEVEAECKSPSKKLKGHGEDSLNAVPQDGNKLKKKKKKSISALQNDCEEIAQESAQLNHEAKSKERKNKKGKCAEDICEDSRGNKEENYSPNNENEAKESESSKKNFEESDLNKTNEESGKKKSNKRKHEASFISYLNEETIDDTICKKKRKFNEEDNSEVTKHKEKKKKKKLTEIESRDDIGGNLKIESNVNEENSKKNKKKSKDKNAAGVFLHKLEEKFGKKKKEIPEENNEEEKTKNKSKKAEIGIDNVCFEDFNATEVNEISEQKISKKKKKKSKKENAGIENSCFEDLNDSKENSNVENPYEIKVKQKNKKKVTNKEEEDGGRCVYENPNFSVNDYEEINENCKKNSNYEIKRPEQHGIDNRALAIKQDDIIEDDLVLNVTFEAPSQPPTPIIVTPAANSKTRRRKSVRFSNVNEECIIPSKDDQNLSIEEYRKKMELFDINAKVIQRGLEQQRKMELESGCVNGGFDIRTVDSTSFYSRTLEAKQTSTNSGVANIGFNDVQEIAEQIDTCQAQVENDMNEAKDNRANVLIGESGASVSNVDSADAVRLCFKSVAFKNVYDYSLQYNLDSPKRSYKHLIKGDVLLHFKNTNLGEIKGYATNA